MIFFSSFFLFPIFLINNVLCVSDKHADIFKSVSSQTNLKALNVDSQTCLLCELIVQVIDFQLESEASIERIRTALFGLCDSLQPGMEEDCKAIIFQLDLQSIINILVELGLRPKAVCEYLSLCP